MANKIKAQNQYGVAWPMTFATITPRQGDIVRITGNETVDQAVATHVPRGEVVKPTTDTAVKGTVMLKGRAVIEVLLSGTIAAGAEVKMAALSGSEQQVAAWVQGTDNENLKAGWVLKGATNALGLVVLY